MRGLSLLAGFCLERRRDEMLAVVCGAGGEGQQCQAPGEALVGLERSGLHVGLCMGFTGK